MVYEPRTYRSIFKGKNLAFFDVQVYETDLKIGAVMNLYSEAYEAVVKYRQQLNDYIKMDHQFLHSLKPVSAKPDAPDIISRMCDAASKTGVGPMAAVAGAISENVGFELLKYSSEVIVENGGDIFMKTCTPRKVGIFAGSSPLSEKIAIEIDPRNTPLGICTSSGTVGHSLSFGKADAAVIISKDTYLADAAATAIGNIVKSPDDINKALSFASGIKGVKGAIVIIGDRMGACGDITLKPL